VLSRQYTKIEILSEEVFQRKVAGETNREIGFQHPRLCQSASVHF